MSFLCVARAYVSGVGHPKSDGGSCLVGWLELDGVVVVVVVGSVGVADDGAKCRWYLDFIN